jgi:hypothetical protein
MLGPHADGGDPRASQGSARAGDGIARPVGRPIAASESQQQQVRAYHKEGKSKRWIAESMTLSRRTVDTIINKADGTDRSTVKRRVKLGVPTLPQPKRAQVVIRPGYFSVVVWALVAPLLLAVYLALIGLIKDYTPDRYELSKSRHSSPTQSLAIAPPSTLDTTSEAALAAQPKAQSAPEIPAKVEPTAQAEPEIPAKVEPTAEAALEIPAKVEPAAEAAPEIPAKVEPTAEAAPEIPAKVEPVARAPRAQAPSRKKQSQQQRAAQSTDPPWSRDADSFIRYIFFGRVD